MRFDRRQVNSNLRHEKSSTRQPPWSLLFLGYGRDGEPEVHPGTIQEEKEKSESSLEPGYLVILLERPGELYGIRHACFSKRSSAGPGKKAEFHMLQVP